MAATPTRISHGRRYENRRVRSRTYLAGLRIARLDWFEVDRASSSVARTPSMLGGFLLQQVADLGEQELIFRRRLGSRRRGGLLTLHAVHHLDDQEQAEGHDDEVD